MNRRNWRQLVLAGVTLALTVWCGIAYLTPAATQAAGSEDDATPGAVDADNGVAIATPEKPSNWDATAWAPVAWAADPFFGHRPAANVDAAAESPRPSLADSTLEPLILTGIIGGEPPMAIINGRIVSVGSEIADDTWIIVITDRAVKVRNKSGTFDIRLRDD